ncbi:ATP-binding cassette domain-containing protein [Lacticaseibacillus kribbianus]|uniref:ATP-binding cassette domain-containing protein n=1 Tax=Lacticaseibacillus kribbianus TaxID=2926292 RepID=UPI001CD626B8|nr:excinuclease ABC subunit UvrA [Lacticaseibacillus kribbianus]
MTATDWIEIHGDRQNNLQDIDLRIPKHRITVFTGVSGSGKSSVVFDTIAQEAGRQLNSTFSNFARLFLPKYQRPDVDAVANLSPAVVIAQKPLGGNARSTLGTISDLNPLLRLLFSRFGKPAHGHAANAFSFNDPEGMCPTCQGIGETYVLNLDHALERRLSLRQGAILLPNYGESGYYLGQLLKTKLFDPDLPLAEWPEARLQLLINGAADEATRKKQKFEGIGRQFFRLNIGSDQDTGAGAAKRLAEFADTATCPDCGGRRYNADVLACRINGLNLFDLTDMQLDALDQTLAGWDLPEAAPLLADLHRRLGDLIGIGLDYLSLTRDTRTLSGGESQRVKTVQYLGNALTDMLYILDEPSTGLHPRDVHRLNELLLKLRDSGNTVLVVEHDPDVIRCADYIVDMGPGAGRNGGTVTFTGSYAELLQSATLTGRSLTNQLPVKATPRQPTTFLRSQPSNRHNLQDAVLNVPAGLFTVVSGVAGSGKSTLVEQVFAAEHPEAQVIDQSALHANSRSSIATYTGIGDRLRQLFAKASGQPAGFFSANSKGACPRCKGKGAITLNLSFMDDRFSVVCPDCGGTKFRPEVAAFHLRGRSIVDMMDMTVDEAVSFFNDQKLSALVATIQNVGLGYLALGQTLDTLSGGEAQRLKIAAALMQPASLIILDEPTTGLHVADVANMVRIIDDLVEAGNTVVVIEHNTDVMRQADWLIDIGPDGGTRGGRVLYEGAPAGITACAESITAKYL